MGQEKIPRKSKKKLYSKGFQTIRQLLSCNLVTHKKLLSALILALVHAYFKYLFQSQVHVGKIGELKF